MLIEPPVDSTGDDYHKNGCDSAEGGVAGYAIPKFVDVTKPAKEMGLPWTTLMSKDTWDRWVLWTAADTARQIQQYQTERLRNILWNARVASRLLLQQATNINDLVTVPFQITAVPRGGRSKKYRFAAFTLLVTRKSAGQIMGTIVCNTVRAT